MCTRVDFWHRWWLVALGWAAVGWCAAAEKNSSYQAALESITPDDLARHVSRLADDALEGREAGSRGGRAAAEYLARQLAGLRLSGAGHDGGYFQPFPPGFRNVVAMLPGSDPVLKNQVLVVGAHYDHVGYGAPQNSRGPIGYIHNGADDNASGTAAVLELAEAFALLAEPPKRSILFVAFDAEEQGLFGSKYFVAHPPVPLDRVRTMLNLDMIGRLRDDRVLVYGSRSGYGLRRLLCWQNPSPGLVLDFPWTLSEEADHYPFFAQGVAVLMFHTGLHDQYHTPEDKAKWINSSGMSRVARLLFAFAYDLANRPELPAARPAAARENEYTRQVASAVGPRPAERLGVSWHQEPPSSEGVRLTGVAEGSAAARAELRPGDRIILFAGRITCDGEELRRAVRLAEAAAQVVVRRPGHDEPLALSVPLAGKPMRLGITWRVDPAEPGTLILTHVLAGSPAEAAGLFPGDRIYQIGDRDFADEAEFAARVKSLPDPIELLIERDGRVGTVVLYCEGGGSG